MLNPLIHTLVVVVQNNLLGTLLTKLSIELISLITEDGSDKLVRHHKLLSGIVYINAPIGVVQSIVNTIYRIILSALQNCSNGSLLLVRER